MLQLDILHRFYFGGRREDYSAEIKLGVCFYCLCIKFKFKLCFLIIYFFLCQADSLFIFLLIILRFYTSVITCKHIKSKFHWSAISKQQFFLGFHGSLHCIQMLLKILISLSHISSKFCEHLSLVQERKLKKERARDPGSIRMFIKL